METRSLKALSLQRLLGNSQGNSKETKSFLTPVINRSKTDTRETFSDQSFPASKAGNYKETTQPPHEEMDDAKGKKEEKFPKSFLARKPLINNNIKYLDKKVSSFHGVGGNHGNRETGGLECPGNQIDVWDEPMAGLIRWFLNADLPEQPFSPSGYEHILHPATYYKALSRDIQQGPRTPRARYGALQGDLQRLKAYCEERSVHT